MGEDEKQFYRDCGQAYTVYKVHEMSKTLTEANDLASQQRQSIEDLNNQLYEDRRKHETEVENRNHRHDELKELLWLASLPEREKRAYFDQLQLEEERQAAKRLATKIKRQKTKQHKLELWISERQQRLAAGENLGPATEQQCRIEYLDGAASRREEAASRHEAAQETEYAKQDAEYRRVHGEDPKLPAKIMATMTPEQRGAWVREHRPRPIPPVEVTSSRGILRRFMRWVMK